MYPGYRPMDLFPQHSNEMPHAPHFGPGFEVVLPQMKMDTAKFPGNQGFWPYYGSYGYPFPVAYHGCCPHGQFPDYHGWRPYYAPPAPVYCHGSCPPQPGNYPTQYIPPPQPGNYPTQYIPPPHYSANNTLYEYDKNGLGDRHCCGCPNHSCLQKENKDITERQIQNEQQTSDSMVPSGLQNLQYPVLWMPPGYMMNKEDTRSAKSDPMEGEKGPDEEINRSLKPSREPRVWNGWLPIDLNNFKSLMQGGDGKGTQLQQIEDGKSNPFPIYWMPHKPKQGGKLELKEMNGDQMFVEEPSHPMKLLDKQDKKGMPKEPGEGFVNSESEDSSKTVGKHAVKKIIPVKQMGQTEENGVPTDVEKIIPLKQMDQSREKGASKDVEEKVTEMSLKHTNSTGGKQKHSENIRNGNPSVSKESKLPPVCLRIDPLPSRKNKIGTSRSQSPPENNGKSKKLSSENSASTSATQSSVHSSQSSDQSGRKVKTIEVTDSAIKNNNGEDGKEVTSQPQADKTSRSEIRCQTGKRNQDCAVEEHKGPRDVDAGNVREDENSTGKGRSGDHKCVIGEDGQATNKEESKVQTTNGAPRRMKLSEAEAATVIQSVYRGFEVRKWQVLKKLKEIGKIKEEMSKVKSRVQDLVSSNMWRDDKHMMVFGESIMSLLLKLDTMQGLHPDVRDKRKAVAKELVSLQEELDSLTAKNSEDSEKKYAEPGHAEQNSLCASHDACLQGGEQAEGGKHEQDVSAGSLLKSDITEPCKIQTDPVMDVDLASSAAGSSELILGSEEELHSLTAENSEESEKKSVESNARQISPSANCDACLQAREEKHEQDISAGSLLKSDITEPCGIQTDPVMDVDMSSSAAGSSELGLGREEELDSLRAKNSEESEKKSAESRHAEQNSLSANHDACLQGGELAVEEKHEQNISASLLKSDVTLPCKIQTDSVMDENLSPAAAGSSELVSGSTEGEEEEHVLLNHMGTDKQYSEPFNEAKEKLNEGNEVPDISEDHDVLPVESNEIPLPVSSVEKLCSTSQLPNLSSDNSGQTSKDEIVEMLSGLLDQDACAPDSSEGVHIDGEGCIIQSDVPVSDSGLLLHGYEALHGHEAKELRAEEQLPVILGNKCPDLSLMDEVASEEVMGKDIELGGEDMLESELKDDAKERDASDINEVNKLEVRGNDIILDNVEIVDTSRLEKEEASKVNEVEGDEASTEDMTVTVTSRMIREVRSDPELKQPELSVVEESIPDKEEVPAEKIERPDVVEETQVRMEETGNCNMGQEIATDNGHGQEIWDDKFENRETEQTSNYASMFALAGDGHFAKEEVVQDQAEKVVPATTLIPSQASSSITTEIDQKLAEENEKLREEVEKLVAASKEQLTAISSLSGRVKDLEKKLSRKNKLKMRRHCVSRSASTSFVKP